MSISEFDRSSFDVLKPFFIDNADFERFYNIASKFKRATLWTEYQKILLKASALPIEGIQNKLKSSRSDDKLLATLSELRIAVALAEAGHSIKLIPDSDDRVWMISPPDITLSYQGFDAIIEVTRWAPDDSSTYLDEFLTPIAEDKNLILEYYLSSELSELVVTYDDREYRYQELRKVTDCIKEFIESLNPMTLPIERTIKGVKIALKSSRPGQGYVGNPLTIFSIVPDNKYASQLFDRMKKKAGKPKKWPSVKQKLPYFIAVEIEQAIGQHNSISRILYGGTNYISYMNPDDRREPAVKYPEIVVQRLDTDSWREFLLRLGYDSTRQSYIKDVGFFLKEQDASKVCGIITLHSGILEFYPNPFARPEFSRPDYHKLLHLPIADAIL